MGVPKSALTKVVQSNTKRGLKAKSEFLDTTRYVRYGSRCVATISLSNYFLLIFVKNY